MTTNKHVEFFSTKYLQPNETIRTSATGYTDEGNVHHRGALIITTQRVIFFRKGWLGEVFESIPLEKVTSVERKSMLGHKTIRIHTSHDKLEFKTFEGWDFLLAALEERGGGVPVPAPVARRVPPPLKAHASKRSTCPKCSSESNQPDAVFCAKCGQNLSLGSVQASVPPSPAPAVKVPSVVIPTLRRAAGLSVKLVVGFIVLSLGMSSNAWMPAWGAAIVAIVLAAGACFILMRKFGSKNQRQAATVFAVGSCLGILSSLGQADHAARKQKLDEPAAAATSMQLDRTALGH